MKNRFDINAERAYYKKSACQLVVTPDHIVVAQMIFCTGLSLWPSLINNKTVLEVGAGGCSYLKSFFKAAMPKQYIAQDLFAERLAIPKESGKYAGIDYIASDVLSLPIKNQSVDTCMAFGLLHHIPNLEEALAEIRRVLKVGGQFIFRDPCSENPVLWLKYRFGYRSQNEFPLSRKRIKSALEETGFEVINLNRFWLRFPKLPSGPWSVNLGGVAVKK